MREHGLEEVFPRAATGSGYSLRRKKVQLSCMVL